MISQLKAAAASPDGASTAAERAELGRTIAALTIKLADAASWVSSAREVHLEKFGGSADLDLALAGGGPGAVHGSDGGAPAGPVLPGADWR
jgi:hypothetical protein